MHSCQMSRLLCGCFSFNGAYVAANRGIFFALTVTVSEN